MDRRSNITRRDFLNGIALGVAAGGTLSPLEILAQQADGRYPPALTGLRGNHPGSRYPTGWRGPVSAGRSPTA